jgi:hypothetical protein
MVFTNTKSVHAHLVGMFDLLDQLSHAIRRIRRTTVLVERRRETVNPHLHRGNEAAAMFANVYYPRADRSVTTTLTRWGMQVMWDSLSNELKEFWPDIRRKIRRQ